MTRAAPPATTRSRWICNGSACEWLRSAACWATSRAHIQECGWSCDATSRKSQPKPSNSRRGPESQQFQTRRAVEPHGSLRRGRRTCKRISRSMTCDSEHTRRSEGMSEAVSRTVTGGSGTVGRVTASSCRQRRACLRPVPTAGWAVRRWSLAVFVIVSQFDIRSYGAHWGVVRGLSGASKTPKPQLF